LKFQEFTLHTNYIEKFCLNTVQSGRHYVGDKKIWVSVDEMTDIEGRIFSKYCYWFPAENARKSLLLHSDVLEKTNQLTIAKVFDKAMFMF